jgi:hypothetical protein
MEIDNVIGKIRKLCQLTVEKGCSEGEAMNAATRVGELLQTYNLTIDKVFLDKQDCVRYDIPVGRRRVHPIDGCVMAIADMCDCKMWRNVGYKQNYSYGVFGLETDVEMCKYLYSFIYQAIENETNNFKLSEEYLNAFCHRKSLTVSFQHGMSHRIASRLREMADERHERESTATQAGTTDIVLIKMDKVESELEKLGIKFTKRYQASRNRNWSAYTRGSEAGDKLNLNRPIGGGRAEPKGYLE